jgi:LuxR family quorum sensing-dependent transcriptional regulator
VNQLTHRKLQLCYRRKERTDTAEEATIEAQFQIISGEASMEITISNHAVIDDKTTKVARGISLSKREQEVLQWAAEGKSEWEIGLILGLSEHTADKCIRSARMKLHARNRTHAVAQALRLGLIA